MNYLLHSIRWACAYHLKIHSPWMVALPFILALPVLTQGYDNGECQRTFPAGAIIHDVDYLRIDTGNYYMADFGDDLHLGGAPQGTGVICWQQGRNRVAIIGKLYFDPRDSGSQGCSKITVEIYRRDGSLVESKNDRVCGGYDTWMDRGLRTRDIRYVVSGQNLHTVRIRLYRLTGIPPGSDELAYTVTRHYGD